MIEALLRPVIEYVISDDRWGSQVCIPHCFAAFSIAYTITILIASEEAKATPLVSTVKAAYQTDYRVKVCGCGFKQYFAATGEPFTGFESTENLMTSVMNVIDVINGQLETNLRLRWDGFLDDAWDPGPDGLLCSSVPAVCLTASSYYLQGYVVVRALPTCVANNTACLPDADWRGTCPDPAPANGCGIERCFVEFCDKSLSGVEQNLVMKDSLPGRTFQSSLLHEMLHDIGFLVGGGNGGNAPNSEPFSSLNSSQNSRFPWDEDCLQAGLEPTGGTGFSPYTRTQNLRIRHIASPDAGANWYYGTDSNLNQYSNDPIGIAINTSSSPAQLLMAFTDSSEPRRIKTILGTTTSSTSIAWDSSSLVVHPYPAESWFGPSVAFGGDQWVMAWSDRGISNDFSGVDGRAIYYAYSFDGRNWTAPIMINWTCDGCSPLEYGSLGVPVVRYNANRDRFIIMWVNWFSATEIPLPENDVGSIRQCTLVPGIFTMVSNCSNIESPDGTSLMYTWNVPSLSCHPIYNLCCFAKIPEDGDSSNIFRTYLGRLESNDAFDTSSSVPIQSGWTSRNEVSGAFGNNSHYIAYRNQNTGNYITIGKYLSSPPGWSEKRTIGVSVPVAPSLVIGPGDDIRIYYVGP